VFAGGGANPLDFLSVPPDRNTSCADVLAGTPTNINPVSMTGERTIFLRRPAASSASSSTKDPGRGTLRLAPWRPLRRILSTEARTRTWRNFKNFGGVAAKSVDIDHIGRFIQKKNRSTVDIRISTVQDHPKTLFEIWLNA